ncbi:MAG: signal peptidase I [Dysgonamonadaceae bacterium]|jgi:signal peptidase I|nr:signal peptidase I [Dysgonamonadaceae bacterium]
MKKATKTQWILFAIWAVVYVLFTIWIGNFWLLFGLPVLFDIYISKIIPWGVWKKTKNKTLQKVVEWIDAILFALAAVYIINLFIFQMYTIPSSSLEKTLLVGDYLMVNKFSYGPRIPNTPLSFPLAQHTMPIINTKSYIEHPQWKYKRLKGLGDVKRYDIVVFNFPAGDTVARKKENPDYYYSVNQKGWDRVNSDKWEYGDIVWRPVDRRENYVKRCVGMPGDNLQIISDTVFIDGKALPFPKKIQLNYLVETNGTIWGDKEFGMLGVSNADKGFLLNRSAYFEWIFAAAGIEKNADSTYNPVYIVPLTQEAVEKLKKSGKARSVHVETFAVRSLIYETQPVYPYNYQQNWNVSNFGPLWIPKKGATVELNEKNIALYGRCIVNYEGNTLEQKDGKTLINGQSVTNYTFRYDYYFMMGDNRHNSQDSRSWGFVPEDHIVGKPVFVWLSLDNDKGWFNGKIRWSRMFRTVGTD